jgi:hypothetical protein
MTTLLHELCTELNAAFDRYDRINDVGMKLNSVYVPRIKTKINGAISAYRLINDLPFDIKRLETKFWSFLPFVKDPIRDLKGELENILSKEQYQPLNALEAEGVELRTEGIELRRENQNLRACSKSFIDGILAVSEFVARHYSERSFLLYLFFLAQCILSGNLRQSMGRSKLCSF